MSSPLGESPTLAEMLLDTSALTPGPVVVLLDTSASMAEWVGAHRRIGIMGNIFGQVLPTTPGARVFVFNSWVREIEPLGPLPEPEGASSRSDGLL
jgi:hypothetical protein